MKPLTILLVLVWASTAAQANHRGDYRDDDSDEMPPLRRVRQVLVVNEDPILVELSTPTPPVVCPGNGAQTPSVLLGLTTEPVEASVGLFTLQRACGAAFDGSHMCSSEEVRGTANPPTLPPMTRAWVQFTPSGVDRRDVSGLALPDFHDCIGWTLTSAVAGISVDDLGAFRQEPCNLNPLLVACCGVEP